jgi:hypothetical protein
MDVPGLNKNKDMEIGVRLGLVLGERIVWNSYKNGRPG